MALAGEEAAGPHGLAMNAGPDDSQHFESKQSSSDAAAVFDVPAALGTQQRESVENQKQQQKQQKHGRWGMLTPHHVREHPAFKRNKLTLLSMGIAVVLVSFALLR